MNKTEVEALLKAYGIPLSQWGTGEAKTLNHLMVEISSGETVLEEEDGYLVRICTGAGLLLYYRSGNELRLLKEDRQVFNDGRVRRRDLETAPGEKLRPNEQPIAAAYRALQEELGIGEHIPLKLKEPIVKGLAPSISFPGLMSTYFVHVFEGFLPDHLYKPEGYIEKQSDKTNYFVWVRVPSEVK